MYGQLIKYKVLMYVHFDQKIQQFIIQLIQLFKHSDVNQINYI